MTLTIQQERDDQRQLKLTIAVDEKRVQKVMRQTARKLARDIAVPGFRRGKAPYNVVVSRVGKSALRAEAIDSILPDVFEEALEQIDLKDNEMYTNAQPKMDDLDVEPLVLKVTLPLAPMMTLGEYRSIRKEVKPIVITDEAVAEALEEIRIQHQTLEPSDDPVQLGDLVALSGSGELILSEKPAMQAADMEGEATVEAIDVEGGSEDSFEVDEGIDPLIFNEENVQIIMEGDKVAYGDAFVQQIVGLSVGDAHTFEIEYPEDFRDEELAGQKATFDISVLDIQKRELPPLDDELAKLAGSYETLEELQDSVYRNLTQQAETQARDERIEEMVNALWEDAEIVYPPAAVEREIDGMVEELRGRIDSMQWEWDDFLTMQGMNEDTLRANFRDEAAKKLERQLLLQQFVIDEKITVEMEDVDAMIAERVNEMDVDDSYREQMEEFFRGAGFNMISSQILVKKVDERIQAIYSGVAPDLTALEADNNIQIDEEE